MELAEIYMANGEKQIFWRELDLADKHKIDILLATRIKQNENYNNDVYGPKDK